MVTWFYFIVFLLALIMTGSYLIRNKNVDTVFILFSLSVTFNCMGRYMLATSQSLEMAILSNTIIYVGGCYAPLMTIFILAKLCNLKLPTILSVGLVCYSTLIMGLVLTIGKSEIYYKDVELGYVDGYSYLIKTYGPLHILYPVMIFIYASIMIFYVAYAIKKSKQISSRTVLLMSSTGFSISFLYILERLIDSKVSFLSVGYLIEIAWLIVYLERINMYDTSTNIINFIEKMNEYGYIAFDDEYRYVNSNNMVKDLFPEINAWIVDKKVPVSDSYLYKEVVQYLIEWNGEENTNKIINVGDSYFQINIRYISHGKKVKAGYLLELVDRTIEKKYYNTIEEYNASMEKKWQRKLQSLESSRRESRSYLYNQLQHLVTR